MQCPKCGHEPTMNEQLASPEQCPGCGVYYAKAQAAQRASIQDAAKRGGFRLAADHVEASTRGLSGAQPVVVVDVQMRFWSMVVFMVKWALASIPALVILGVLASLSFTMMMALIIPK